MQIIKNILEIPMGFEPFVHIEDICFFDIETTGLSREYHQIYLIGMLSFNKESNDWTLVQLFADDLRDEENLLISFMDMTKDFDSLVTYNGDSFDIPFVKKRLEGFGHHWNPANSLDLYKFVRENRDILDLPDLKLKTLEKHLGIHRDDLISGKDCIDLYKSYTITKSIDTLKPILKHNYDDLQYMPCLLQIFNIVDGHKTVNIKAVEPNVMLFLDKIVFTEDKLSIAGIYHPKFTIPWIYYRPLYTLILDKENLFQFTIETKKARLSEDILAEIVDTRFIDELDIEYDLSPHESPDGILILRANKNIYLKNIKLMIEKLFLYHYLEHF